MKGNAPLFFRVVSLLFDRSDGKRLGKRRAGWYACLTDRSTDRPNRSGEQTDALASLPFRSIRLVRCAYSRHRGAGNLFPRSGIPSNDFLQRRLLMCVG